MVKRLVELYKLGDRVKITSGDETWWPGVVVGHDHPGIWVKTQDGGWWFVTNPRRIQMDDS
jgi:hypothetical protein